jgi:hypothetical protein
MPQTDHSHNDPHRLQPSRKQAEPNGRDRPDEARLEIVRLSDWKAQRGDGGSNGLAQRNVSLAQRRAQDRLRAVDASESISADDAFHVGWLWLGRIPMRKLSLITGETGDANRSSQPTSSPA